MVKQPTDWNEKKKSFSLSVTREVQLLEDKRQSLETESYETYNRGTF